MGNETKEPEDAILHVSGFAGELRCGDKSVPATWSITIGKHGGIALTLEPIPLDASSKWMFDVAFPSGPLLERLSIHGKNPDGITCETDHFYVITCNTTSDDQGNRLFLTGDASRLRLLYLPVSETSTGLRTIYFTVGMRAFGAPGVETNAGRLTLVAPTKLEEPDDISGRVHIKSPDDKRPVERWLSDCDAVVLRVLDMVSLAEGGLIRWSARQLESEKGLVAIDCEGPKESGPVFDGLFTHLNLQPVLELALERYTEELCQRTGLAVALEWFVHHPRYAELQLIAASTALEHLIAVFVKNRTTPKLVSTELFGSRLADMKKGWEDAVKAASESDQELIPRIIQKLGRLNDGSFYDKVVSLTEHYKVPLVGIDLKDVKVAIDARNAIIHRGLYRSKEEERQLYQHVNVLRQLLKMIFLTFLEYKGEYFSLLNGPKYLQFPP